VTLALTMGVAAVPVTSAATGLPLPSTLAPKKVKKDGLTPEQAAERRAPTQEQGRQMVSAGELTAATILYDNAAQSAGDPVLFLDAGDTWLAVAEKDRDAAAAETAKQRAQVAQDILYFHLDSSSDPDYRQVANEDVAGLLARASLMIEKADDLVEEIQTESEAVATPEAAPKKRPPGNGRGLRIAGAALMGVGVAGVGVGVTGLILGGIHQQSAEDPTVYGAEYDAVDAKGKRANLLATVGLVAGGVTLAVGVTLFVIGKVRGNKAGAGPQDSTARTRARSLALVPAGRGVAVTGRF
jgi:hypothetical protein